MRLGDEACKLSVTLCGFVVGRSDTAAPFDSPYQILFTFADKHQKNIFDFCMTSRALNNCACHSTVHRTLACAFRAGEVWFTEDKHFP